MTGLQGDLDALEKSHAAQADATSRLLSLASTLSSKVAEVVKVAEVARRARSVQADDRLLAALEELREMQVSFNLQVLVLQNQIAHENRQFTLISNLMRSKHDTAKNSINNIR